MFPQTKAWQAYRQVATQTASPAQVVLLLYNGTIRFLEQARSGFGLDDPKEQNETINNNIQRAQAIINEMNQSLNMAEGGEFAQKRCFETVSSLAFRFRMMNCSARLSTE